MGVGKLRLIRLSVYLISWVLLIVGCGGYEQGGGKTSGATPSPTAPQVSSIVKTTIKDFALPELTVIVGATVTWTQEDAEGHTTTSGSTGKHDGVGWDSPILQKGESFSYTFSKTGTFPYACRFHSEMKGTVTVKAPGSPTK